MKIHSDILTWNHIHKAAILARTEHDGATYADITRKGSRIRAAAHDVHLIGDGTFSRRRTNPGAGNADRSDLDYAATWCAWGIFLAALYDVDPTMVCGGTATRPVYASREDFHRKTAWLFDDAARPVGHRPAGLLPYAY